MNLNDFKNKLKELNIDYTGEMINKLDEYYKFLIQYNSHTNLTAITKIEDVYLKHFYDSLMISKAIDLTKINSLLDIGSGAGFPGIVLKIFYPNIKVTVLDSNNKKTTFLKELVTKLSLKDVVVINQRAEDYAKNNLKFDVVVSRAVSYIDIILTLSSYFVNDEGQILLMKGNINEELEILNKHKNDLNVSEYKVINCNLDENNERNIISIRIKTNNNKLLNYSQIIKRHNKWTMK